jgi:superfamily II DNA or RNA helicase
MQRSQLVVAHHVGPEVNDVLIVECKINALCHSFRELYSHQAATAELVRNGNNVVVVTPTASGKTLCYNLPVLNAILENSDTRSLYLFPTKALAQDQLAILPAQVLIRRDSNHQIVRSKVRVLGRCMILTNRSSASKSIAMWYPVACH